MPVILSTAREFNVDPRDLFFNLGQLLEIEIDVPIWWMYLAFPVGFFILGLVAIELLIENIKDLIKLN